ncbi:prenyltransferase [Trichophyton mentagrophytes]|nr:prenyltransferase [Trichophyton mentagrophytes]
MTSVPIFESVSRFLPPANEDEQYWWKITGRHMARMMHEAGYPEDRQVECLLFHRFKVIPCLGPRPRSDTPWYKSRVGGGAADGCPINYSWRFGTADRKPHIRNFIESLGALTNTPADPLNEVATKALLQDYSMTLPNVDLEAFWTFAPHYRPRIIEKADIEKLAGASLLVGAEMSPDSHTIDIKAYMYPRVPSQTSQLLTTILPQAMRDAYGENVCLDSLNFVHEFMTKDPQGSQLVLTGTTGIDCCKLQDTRVKIYVITRNTSFDHIAAIMTLGGRRPISEELLGQLKALWYELKGAPAELPSSEQLPVQTKPDGSKNPIVVPFYFDIQPRLALPDVKAYIDVSTSPVSDLAAANAVVRHLEQHGSGQNPKAYLNVLKDITPVEELETQKGALAFYSVAVKKNELDITSYFNPQVYKRYFAHEVHLNGQRRSVFE